MSDCTVLLEHSLQRLLCNTSCKTLTQSYSVRIRTESATATAASLGTEPNLCDGNEPYHHRQHSSL